MRLWPRNGGDRFLFSVFALQTLSAAVAWADPSPRITWWAETLFRFVSLSLSCVLAAGMLLAPIGPDNPPRSE